MAAKIKVEIDVDGKKHQLTVKPATLRKFEKQFAMTWNEYQENPSVDGLYWISWQSMLREGLTTDGYEQWIDTVDDIDAVEAGEEHPKDQEVLSSDNTSNSPSN